MFDIPCLKLVAMWLPWLIGYQSGGADAHDQVSREAVAQQRRVGRGERIGLWLRHSPTDGQDSCLYAQIPHFGRSAALAHDRPPRRALDARYGARRGEAASWRG